MFGIVRIIFWSFIFAICIFLIKKKRYSRKNMIFAVAIMVMLCTLSGIAPIENCFLTFSTPEKAFNYVNFEKTVLVVDGEESTLVVGEKEKLDYVYSVIPKVKDGWKLGLGLNVKKIIERYCDGITIYVYQYKNSSDYFIIIIDTNGGELTISDEYNTKFISLEGNSDSFGKNFVTYYAHIANLNLQYSVTINDNKIVLGNQ